MKKRPSGSMREVHAIPSEERPTLMTCEACAGNGRVDAASAPGSYRIVPCQWCDGVGFFNSRRRAAYRRWKRIKAHHVASGRCG